MVLIFSLYIYIFVYLLDLPQLHVKSYNSKEKYLHFDYFPGDDRLIKLNNDQLCLNIRQSSDGKFYQLIKQCLEIKNHRVQWKIDREYSYLKLSICSKKSRNICGPEIEMKEGKNKFIEFFLFLKKKTLFLEINNQYFTPMIIGIIIMTNFLILVIIIIIIFIYCRVKNKRLRSNINNFDKSVRP